MGVLVYLICIAVASFAVLAQPAVAQITHTTLTYPGQVLQGDGSQTCPSETQRERERNQVDSTTLSLLRETVVPLLQNCGGSTGWRRVVYLNMSDPSQRCPSVWQEITTPHRVCGRRLSTRGCEGLTYSTGSQQYDQVCGRIIGYQLGHPDAFRSSTPTIDNRYAEGISVTRGFPRQHIWTFAAGIDERNTLSSSTCPCVNGSTAGNNIPSFVGQNYFCETGIARYDGSGNVFWPNGDPLWDGQGCGPTSSCCTFNSPPWFNVRLPNATTDYVEVRLCGHGITNEDSPIQLMELYVR